jgi:L-seryl-tRNA(Ser) seleniumtransferase
MERVSRSTDRLRDLPSIDRLLAHGRSRALLARFRREHVLKRSREILDDLRRAIRDGRAAEPPALSDESILTALEARLADDEAASLTRVVNATGTVLHTNLGRAILARPAVDALIEAATSAVNLEFDLAAGERGRREDAVERLLVELTGAEAATVVNNNAAAVLVALNSLAEGREVVVSRGELIEIGGAFRLPDIMAKSGVVLKEVGTTNRTHLADYAGAIGPGTALLLKVHTSNYRVVGFASEVGLPELVALGKSRGVPVMEDLGSGALVDLGRYGLPKEPVVSERVAMGADVVTFSGDKILGGPQAGLVAGTREAVRRMSANPLHRVLRCGKLTLAALEATLRVYRQSVNPADDLPTLRAFTRPLDELDAVGRDAVARLEQALGSGFRITLEDSTAQVGSGALPTEEIPTRVIAIEHDVTSADDLAARFRRSRPPIIGRIRDGRFLLDLRLIDDAGDLVPA